ncbi:MAG: hypothetical protein LBH85_06645, partial [Treponema sp.]|nr:hypothetical protein [Treponema sp.]
GRPAVLHLSRIPTLKYGSGFIKGASGSVTPSGTAQPASGGTGATNGAYDDATKGACGVFSFSASQRWNTGSGSIKGKSGAMLKPSSG